MARTFKVSTTLGLSFELEVIEKTKDLIVLKERSTGKLYKVVFKEACNGKYVLDVNGELYSIFSSKSQGIYLDSEPLLVSRVVQLKVEEKPSKPSEKPVAPVAEPGVVYSPITGRVVEVKVLPGSRVNRGDVLLIMESMKMFIEVKSDYSGVVEEVYVSPGMSVEKGGRLVKVKITD